MLTHDNAYRTVDERGNMLGKPLPHVITAVPYKTFDGRTIDHRTYDSTGAFLVGELERLDQTMHPPLASVSWGRDVDLREDVTIADEVSSYSTTTYGSAGGLGTGNAIGNGKAWIGKETNQVTGVSIDINKIPHPLQPWGQEIKYTVLELESAAKLGRPVDAQKYAAMQLKHQMDIDEMVYYGDSGMALYGLVNSNNRTGADAVTNVANVAPGVAGPTTWVSKTADEILEDVNEILTSAWAQSAWAVIPQRLLLPPAQFGYIATAKVSQAGSVSILKYVQENNLLATSGRGKLDIYPTKWLIGAGQGGTIGTTGTVDRMIVYTKDKQYVRFPLTMLQRTPVQYDSIWHKVTYFNRIGVLEVVYPDTIAYRDGI